MEMKAQDFRFEMRWQTSCTEEEAWQLWKKLLCLACLTSIPHKLIVEVALKIVEDGREKTTKRVFSRMEKIVGVYEYNFTDKTPSFDLLLWIDNPSMYGVKR